MIYQNTFEIFGDPAPCECESVEEYAEIILPLFARQGRYWVEPPMNVGMSNEVDWTKRAWETAVEEAEERGETVSDEEDSLPISEAALLDLLTEAVEEVTRDEYTIALDAQFDLFVAGQPCEDSDCEAFEALYNDAAAEIAEERGITIYILNIRGCGYESDRSQEADKDEEARELWQAIHDRI